MIYLYSGTPGSGKSLHQARDIYFWLRSGKPVIANFKISTSKIKKHKDDKLEFYYINNMFLLTPEELKNISKEYFSNHKFKEGTIRLYIDEAQLYFNSREYQKDNRLEWIEFFSQHRKYGFDIFLISQYDRMLDRQIRSLIEYEVIHRKVSNIGKWGKFFSLFSLGNLFVAIKMWYPLHERLSADFFPYNKKYGDIYNTYKDFSIQEN